MLSAGKHRHKDLQIKEEACGEAVMLSSLRESTKHPPFLMSV